MILASIGLMFILAGVAFAVTVFIYAAVNPVNGQDDDEED